MSKAKALNMNNECSQVTLHCDISNMMSRSAPDPVYTLRGSESSLSYLKFDGNETLYSGNYDGTVHVWCMETRRAVSKVVAHPSHSVLYLDFSDDSSMITHGREGSVKLWKRTESDWCHNVTLKCCNTGFCGSCVLPDKLLAVPGINQSEVEVYDLNSRKVIGHLKPDLSKDKCGMCMKIKRANNLDKRELLTGYEDGSVALWDLRQNKIIDKLKVHTDAIMCMDYCSVLNKGFSGSVGEDLNSWTLCEDKINLSVSVKTTNPGFNDTLVRKDGKIVVFAGWDGNIRIFGAKKLKPLAVLNYHKESVHCLAFSEENILACGSKDEQITLWDIYRGSHA